MDVVVSAQQTAERSHKESRRAVATEGDTVDGVFASADPTLQSGGVTLCGVITQ
jgi:hypothetical protein